MMKKFLLILMVFALAVAGGTAAFRTGDATLTPTNSDSTTPPDTEPSGSPEPAETTDQSGIHPPVGGQPFRSSANATPTPSPEPAPQYYVLSFVGDCTLASTPNFQGGPSGYDTVIDGDWAYPFAKTVRYFENDDFTFANLECCLTDATAAVAKSFTFKADPEYAQILTDGSVEFVSLANNHVLDYGQQGYDDTKAAVAAQGIGFAGRDEYTVFETARGLKIGVYAVSFGSMEQIQKGVQAVRATGADFVIAALHWGDEGSYTPNATQVAQAHAAIDAGADFVYGSHPHTIQPVEEYNGHYIYYSFANWTFGGNTNPTDKDTFLLRMTLLQDVDGSITMVNREHVPCSVSGESDRNNYQPVPYETDSEDWKRVLSKLDGSFEGSDLIVTYGYTANE